MPDINAWKVTFIFQEGRFDGMETYFADGSLDATTVQSQAVTLAGFRSAMLPVAVTIFRIRISAAFAPYQTFLVDPQLFANLPKWVPALGETQDGNPDQAKATLQTDKYSGLRHQRGRFFLFGIPDLTLGGANDPRAALSPASWKNAFDSWAANVVANWRNRFRTDTTAGGLRVQASAVDNAGVNGLFRVALPTQDPASWSIGANVQLRKFTQIKGTQLRINGVYQIVNRADNTPAAGTMTITVRNNIIPDSTSVIGLGTAELVRFALAQITKVVPVEQTTRKRGNRSLVGPGRRPIRR